MRARISLDESKGPKSLNKSFNGVEFALKQGEARYITNPALIESLQAVYGVTVTIVEDEAKPAAAAEKPAKGKKASKAPPPPVEEEDEEPEDDESEDDSDDGDESDEDEDEEATGELNEEELKQQNKASLLQLCEERGLKPDATLKKSELIALLLK